MVLSGTGGESKADPAQSPTATFKRFRDVTPTTEVPGSTPKGTPLENKIVIVEYSCEAGKIREQIHP